MFSNSLSQYYPSEPYAILLQDPEIREGHVSPMPPLNIRMEFPYVTLWKIGNEYYPYTAN